ncbi:(d)CMP kinase [Anaerocolumna sedimenticola]|uniref:Cytidylate kinase n=1 Tax=Anaerocolumna sedimenticola TaxID=2696063 RepID=A0A6P1TMF1_9FIRM|nr:(d)CMP kinase [Anaerocolumna sedimenticola]QHQ62194.1 (d)CMP kinase [Anaerocolumna sedimenticola]
MKNYNIAIDGPAGAGKSTIAKNIAKKLQYIYVDTGAMYRAMALSMMRQGISTENEEAVSKACSLIKITIEYIDGLQQVKLNGENVTAFIRDEEVGKNASVVARYNTVRKKMVELQQSLASSSNVIMDGRDIGTVVLPSADLKIFLTASSKTRAFRRWKELEEKGILSNIDDIEADIINRDRQDMNREISPLRQAEDAVLVDSSNLTIDEVIDKIILLFKEKCKGDLI